MLAPLGDVVTIWNTAIVFVPIAECLLSAITGRRGGGEGKENDAIEESLPPRNCYKRFALRLSLAILALVGVAIIVHPHSPSVRKNHNNDSNKKQPQHVISIH